MIINALADYYDELAKNDEVAAIGWSIAKVSFGISLDIDGNLLGIISRKQVNKKGKEYVAQKSVPEQGKKTSGISANFICDSAPYLLGVTSKTEDKKQVERAKNCFLASAELHREILSEVDSSAAKRILRFFDQWDVEKAYDNPWVSKQLTEFGKTGFLEFTDENSIPLYEDTEIRKAWEQYSRKGGDEENKELCLDTGCLDNPAIVHPSVKGIKGAQSSGAALVSFNDNAYESFGNRSSQGLNAPISERTAFKYTTVLNKLIAGKKNIVYLGSKTNVAIIFWAERANHACEELFEMSLDDGKEEINTDELSAIYKQLAVGGSFTLHGNAGSYDNRFYVLGLAPNAARLSVRFFLQGAFGDMIKHLQEHNRRLEIMQPYNETKALPLWKILQETVSTKGDHVVVSPQLEEQMLKAILTGGRYPVELWISILSRIRTEKSLGFSDWEKAAIIKAYLLRNSSESEQIKEVASVSLNQDTDNKAYVLGRLFAVLESLQRSSAGSTLNTTIKDRYFASAAATPGIIFPQLMRLAQSHTKKLSEGAKVYYDKKITELMGKLPVEGYPKKLNLTDQGVFYLGYYHQRQDMFSNTKSENREVDDNE